MTSRVVNMREFPLVDGRRELPDDVVYVGRQVRRQPGSPWGNPYVEGRHGSRDEVIALFRAWLVEILARDPDFLEPLRGKRLACWCAPLACHADVIAELIPTGIEPGAVPEFFAP